MAPTRGDQATSAAAAPTSVGEERGSEGPLEGIGSVVCWLLRCQLGLSQNGYGPPTPVPDGLEAWTGQVWTLDLEAWTGQVWKI